MPFDLFHQGSSYTLTRQDGFTVSLPQALRTKRYVIVYIAGQWWAPCRGVTAQLKSFYRQHHDTLDFEVIFLSTDKSKEAMLDFFHSAHGDWLCLDYKEARALEAELAGDSDLHPKQVPACLVFELDAETMMESVAEGRKSVERVSDVRRMSLDASSLFASTAPISFAQLTTKQGREMLSRDKDGHLFPWYDDGWKDKESMRRSASLRNGSAKKELGSGDAFTPSPGESPAAKARHVDVVMHSNPYAASTEETPATELIIKHRPASAEREEDTTQNEEDEAAAQHQDKELEKEKSDDACEKNEEATPTSPSPVDARGEGVDEEKTTTEQDEEEKGVAAPPTSERQLTYSKSPDAQAERSPSSRIVVMERTLATTIRVTETADVAEYHSNLENGVDNTTEGELESERVVEVREILETHVSAVMEELGPEDDSDGSNDNEEDLEAEFSVIEKQLSHMLPSESAGKGEETKEEKEEENVDAQPPKE